MSWFKKIENSSYLGTPTFIGSVLEGFSKNSSPCSVENNRTNN